MNRLRLPIALAALAALALLLASCGGEDNSDRSPQDVVESATLSGIESGELDLTMSIDAKGKQRSDVDVSLSGPFASGDEGSPPQLDLDAEVKGTARGDKVDFSGGLVLLPNSAYVNYEGTEYEVDPTTYSFVESALKRSQRQSGSSGGPTACQEAASELDVANFADNLSNDGSADVGGTETTKLSGDLDVSGALDSLVELSEDPACKSQLGSSGVPGAADLARAKDTVGKAVKRAHVDLYVGDDDIIRRITVQLAVAPRAQGKSERAQVELDLTLTGVNEEQEIAAPQKARPLSDLFVKLGVNPLELAGALQNGDIGGLLEGLNGDVGGLDGLGGLGGSSGGNGGGGGGGEPQSYADCIREASSPAELQDCAALL